MSGQGVIYRAKREQSSVYLSELVSGLRRRWWAAALGLLGTAALVYGVLQTIPLDQEARASVLVLPPASSVTTTGNPYLALGGLEPAADVLANAMNNGSVHTELAPRGSSSDFTVYRDSGSSGPLLVVDAIGTDPDQALAMVSAVVDRMPEVFKNLQSQVDVRASNLMSLSVVTQDSEALPSSKSRTRILLLAVVGGLAATVFGTSLLDGLLMRRRAARAARAAEREAAARTTAESTATAQRGSRTVPIAAEASVDDAAADGREPHPALTPP